MSEKKEALSRINELIREGKFLLKIDKLDVLKTAHRNWSIEVRIFLKQYQLEKYELIFKTTAYDDEFEKILIRIEKQIKRLEETVLPLIQIESNLEEAQKKKRNDRLIKLVPLYIATISAIAFFGYKFASDLETFGGFDFSISKLDLFVVATTLTTTITYIIVNFREKINGDFVDIDRRKKAEKLSFEGINVAVVSNGNETEPDKSAILNSVEQYLLEIIRVIEANADSSDEKGSKLLDKGTRYAKVGIGFFILSIIVWQLLSYFGGGFKTQYIYGIVSVSFAFLFIEFLSAWFLKQYRHYADTATYLLKIKSIFDKYMLLVLYAKGLPDADKQAKDIIKKLGEEIKWPDVSTFSKMDVNFAKEALETASSLLKSARDFVPQKNDDKKTE